MKRKILYIIITFILMVFSAKSADAALKKCNNDNTLFKCQYSGIKVTLNKNSKTIQVDGMPASGLSNLQLDDFIKNKKYYCPDEIYTACLDLGQVSHLGCNHTGYYLNDKPKLYDQFGKKNTTSVKDSDRKSLKINKDESCLNSNVKVTKKSCTYYKYDVKDYNNPETRINVTINEETHKISSDNNIFNDDLTNTWEQIISSYTNATCYVIYNCNGHYYFSTMDAPSQDQESCKEVCDISDKNCSNKICPKYSEEMDNINKAYKDYKKSCKTKDGCESRYLTLANGYISYTRILCRSFLQNRNATDYCVQRCLSLGDDIEQLKKDNDIEQGVGNGCNLSDNIIAFIYNILKWMKYIAPVLVIVLGMLDFIKALAASDDDAMKKAQKKFIIRLVAAVLLFLLPLIIDYVLSIFHLANDNCNITKIFK